MIRWRYLFTRLVFIAIVLVLVCWGLGPIAGYLTVRSIESATGAKVEIDNTTVGLFPPRVHYSDFRVADPRGDKAMRDAFRAESIDLVIDSNSLLHRRWVAQNARISGIQIDSQRASSGHYNEQVDPTASPDNSTGMLGSFLRQATDQLGDQAENVVGGLETVRRSKEIRGRWEREYDALVVRARNLEKRIREIRDVARDIDNPLRDWAELDRTLARATETRNELKVVRETIDGLPDRLKADLVSLDRAKQIDMEKIDRFVPGSLSQSDNFGVDLMTKAVRDQIEKVRGYLDGGRTLVDYTVAAPEASERSRGVDYDLLGTNRPPQIMVKRCEVSGFFTDSGEEYLLTGVVENISPESDRLAEPTTAKLRLDGPDVVRVEITRDRRNGADADLVTLHWPEIDAKPMSLGNDSDAGINIQGGKRELWVQLRNVNDRITGRLVSKQTGVKMNLNMNPKYKDSPAAIALAQSLAGVDSLEVDANFAGTWDDMQLQLSSNIGPVFANAAKSAVVSQIESSKRKLASKVEQTHLQEKLGLRSWLETRQSEAQTLLVSADKTIKEMRDKVIAEVGETDLYIGKLRSAIEGRLR